MNTTAFLADRLADCALAVLATFLALAAPAATWQVNDTRDAADAAPGDAACEASPGQGDCTLRAAIQEANAVPGADEILVPAGRFELSLTGEHEDASALGDLDLLDDVSLRGAGPLATIIDGNGLDRVFDVPAEGSTVDVVLEGVGITGGSCAGVRVLGHGSLQLRDCAVTDNRTPGSGGGIYAAGGLLLLVRTTVAGNVAGQQAGGIRIHGGRLVIVDSLLERNVVTAEGGAGVFASRSEVVLARSVLRDEVADGSRDALSGLTDRSHLVAGVLGLDAQISTSADEPSAQWLAQAIAAR